LLLLKNYFRWLFKGKSNKDLSTLITTSIGLFIILVTEVFRISSENIVVPIILFFITLNFINLLDDIICKSLGSKNKEIPIGIFVTVLALIGGFSSLINVLVIGNFFN